MAEGRAAGPITGASGGIGHALARRFAEDGRDLVINAEDGRPEDAARGLRGTGAEVRAVPAGLGHVNGVDRLVAATTGLDVDVAVLNAGVGPGLHGHRSRRRPLRDRAGRDLDRTARQAAAARNGPPRYGPAGVRVLGRVDRPGPFQPVHNASKSLVRSFAEAPREEVKDTDVGVTAFPPGPTDADLLRWADPGGTRLGPWTRTTRTSPGRHARRDRAR
ncbi:SDR family NAD(P)-dependent oxidoreductase [Streptomyces sp. KHY 26]|uniref:SDR family NAD(P)-dependent oxidoreductase n=1 Tax=Streptomyces sp. KHY 26 TaxID=3097359 RepID=UPI00376EC9EB